MGKIDDKIIDKITSSCPNNIIEEDQWDYIFKMIIDAYNLGKSEALDQGELRITKEVLLETIQSKIDYAPGKIIPLPDKIKQGELVALDENEVHRIIAEHANITSKYKSKQHLIAGDDVMITHEQFCDLAKAICAKFGTRKSVECEIDKEKLARIVMRKIKWFDSWNQFYSLVEEITQAIANGNVIRNETVSKVNVKTSSY